MIKDLNSGLRPFGSLIQDAEEVGMMEGLVDASELSIEYKMHTGVWIVCIVSCSCKIYLSWKNGNLGMDPCIHHSKKKNTSVSS